MTFPAPFQNYWLGDAYDEMFTRDGEPRPQFQALFDRLRELPLSELRRRKHTADQTFLNQGITFTVYRDGTNIDRPWPYDIIPRTISGRDWDRVEAGLVQRLTALNLFIDDIYNRRRIVADGVVPDWLVDSGKCFRGPCAGLAPPRGVWCHITGTDLVRGGDGVIRSYEVHEPCTVTLLTERRSRGPAGASGGHAGATGRNLLNGAPIPAKCRLELKPGDVVTIETPGGGGWG